MQPTTPVPTTSPRDRLVQEAHGLLERVTRSDEAAPAPVSGLGLRLAADRHSTKRLRLERAVLQLNEARRDLRRARRALEDEVARVRHVLGRPPRPTRSRAE